MVHIKQFVLRWYWNCPKCGSGPFHHVWNTCHCGEKRPDPDDS